MTCSNVEGGCYALLFSTLLLLSLLAYSFPVQAIDKFKEIENIQDAAFRYLIQKHSGSSTFCLSLGANIDGSYVDPNPSFMERFAMDPRTKTAGQCIQNKTGPTLWATDAILLNVGDIKQINKTQVAVRVQYFRNLNQSGAGVCKLEKSKDGTWQVMDFKTVMIRRIGK